MPFVVLPDHPAGAAITRRLPEADSSTVLAHHSGRPWIVGRWPADSAVYAEVGRVRVLVIGRTGIDVPTLTARVRNVRSQSDLDTLAGRLPGTFHLVASIDGEVRVQGSLSTARHVFATTTDGVTVAADDPYRLATLTGAEIDEASVVLRLMSLSPPAPLAERCPWRGVSSPELGCHLVIHPDGSGGVRRWWTPPEPEVPLRAAAPVLRDALARAVVARAGAGGALSADLSGGFDSTNVCFVAAHEGVRLFSVRYRPIDPANDDHRWASRCEDHLSTMDHLVVAPEDAPDWYAETSDATADLVAPDQFIRSRAMIANTATLVAARGATTHLQGLNGDELFHASPMCVHALARTEPAAALPRVRALRAMRRWTLPATARFLLSNDSYPQWLRTCADQLDAPRTNSAEFEWEISPRMPPWATREAVDLARDLLTEAATDARPMDPLAVQHAMLRITRVNGATTRHNSVIGAAHGVTFESPYLDDRILEIAMSVRLADRMEVGRFKPVLAAAMRGIAPDDFLNRQTKGDFSAELYRGLRRQRDRLIRLSEESHLARLGLIDTAALRAVLVGLHSDTRPLMPLEATLACESWLRALPAPERTESR